ncbi:MAG: CHASE3 domain-containing protein [Cyclobacteriaceae bacterium]|nr:CHASE3 domain-containing protein [Cyclobacteriaceae bacterium]
MLVKLKQKLGLSFEFMLLIGFLITITIFSILSFYVYRNNQALLESARKVAHTNEVLLATERLLEDLFQAETGQRGYIITGDSLFLSPYNDAIDSVNYHFNNLKELTSDNPELQADLRELGPVIDQRLQIMTKTLEVRRDEGFESAKRSLQTLLGRTLMMRIRQVIGKMQAAEKKLLTNRKEQTERDIVTFNVAYLTSMSITGIFLIGLFFMIYNNLKKRQVLEDDLKRNIETQRKLSEELAKISNKLTVANRSGGVGIWEWDIVNNILIWDHQMYQLYGITEDSFGGAYESWQQGLHPDDVERCNIEIQEALEGKRKFDSEFRVVWPDSTIHYIKGNGTIERDEKGNPLFMIGTNWDITNLKEREHEVENLNKELESFCYSVSHDLRAPLRSINGYTSALMEDYADKFDHEGKRLLGTVINSAKRMGQLIDDLLNFSKMGRQPLSRIELNMDVLVKQIASELVAEENGRSIELEIKPLGKVKADASMLQQVWVNLLSNALKYSQKKEKSVIKVGRRDDKNKGNIFYVSDNGAGFDMAYGHKLFGVFQRLHKVREFEGTGVGLALAKRIINKHDGDIWAEAEVDKGATFYFSLPDV